MKFEDMNAMQRRLHNAAIVLDGDGDEWGFVWLLREAIDEIESLRSIAHSDDGAVGDGMRMYMEHREMRSLLERIARNPENVSHATWLRDDLMAWAKKTPNEKALRSAPTADVERKETKGKSN